MDYIPGRSYLLPRENHSKKKQLEKRRGWGGAHGGMISHRLVYPFITKVRSGGNKKLTLERLFASKTHSSQISPPQ
jgi:hypothetical protein